MREFREPTTRSKSGPGKEPSPSAAPGLAQQNTMGNSALQELMKAGTADGSSGDGGLAETMGDSAMAEGGGAGGTLAATGGLPLLPLLAAKELYDIYAPPESEPDRPSQEQQAEVANEEVEICSSHLAGDAEHWWLKVGPYERGLAVDAPYVGVPSEISDHDKRSTDGKSSCVPASEVSPRWEEVDPACVLREAAPGTPTGRYGAPRTDGVPGLGPDGSVNHCQAAAADILDRCSPDPDAAAADSSLHALQPLQERVKGQE